MRSVPSIVLSWLRSVSREEEDQEIRIDPELNLPRLGALQGFDAVDADLYLLHYRYEGGEKGKVLLQNIKSGGISMSWEIPLETIHKDLVMLNQDLKEKYLDGRVPVDLTIRVANNISSTMIYSPLLASDSSLLFHCGSLGNKVH